MDADRLLQQLNIGEDQDCEFKDGNRTLPKSLWETLSAFANTEGGYIVLGVSESQNQLSITGVQNPNKLKKEFWDAHNNPQKLSFPICCDADVTDVEIDRKHLLVVRVPKADRTKRPIYINHNVLRGTYKRNFSGDYRCTEEEVRQMLRDAGDDPQDSQILEGFVFDDLDLETIKSFRQRFSSREPDHPWLALDDRNLLIQLGGWRTDRKTGQEGLTLAGLLMFGKERSLLDALPHYQLDYQERLSNKPEERWTYRLTLDGKWEPNLFNFYFRVYGRLVNDLDVPFQLDKDAIRRGETHVHEALREVLVNTLIHADHKSTRPIIVIQNSDHFLFRNPGRLRISIESLFTGGISDPRNPNLQKMFQMIGLGEKAGSGFQKILRAWQEQQWFLPLVKSDAELELTSVALPMASVIPQTVEQEIREIVGDAYSGLTELERIVLMLTHRFGQITNSNVQVYRPDHPRDIGECLKTLVGNGWLQQSGRGRGTRYTLVNQNQSRPLTSPYKDYAEDSEHYAEDSEHYAEDSEHYKRLVEIAAPVRAKSRASQQLVRQVILELCGEEFLPLRILAKLLNRGSDTIRNHYVNPMLEKDLLERRYPDHLHHSHQAYRTRARPNAH
ncbi:MAG: transcriptional regulator [Acaryochloris sp. SU_5_25]|nr:transcriptional regulator [Acaryochloris sp. SU_5_25]